MPSVLVNSFVDTATSSPTRTQVQVSSTWIINFADSQGSDFGYTQSLDGGATWSTFTPIRSVGAGGIWFDIYYERWNSASAPNVIHMVYAYNSDPNRGLYHNTLTLTSGTAVLGTATLALAMTPHGRRDHSIVVASNSRVRIDGTAIGGAVNGVYADSPYTSWTTTGDTPGEYGTPDAGDRLVGWADLSGGADAVCWLFYDHDAAQLSVKRGNASGGGITETIIATITVGIDFNWASGIRKSDGHMYLAAFDSNVVADSKNLKTWDIYGATITARTNVLSTTTYVNQTALAITATGLVYVFYARDSAAATSSRELYYKISADSMVSWGAETRWDDLDSDKVKITVDPSPIGGISPMWGQGDSLYVMYPGIPVADVSQAGFVLSLDESVPIPTAKHGVDLFLSERLGATLGGLTAARFRRSLEPVAGLPLRLHLSSRGGEIDESLQVAEIFEGWPAETEAIVQLAASSALFIALACDRVLMEPSGRLYLHMPKLVTCLGHEVSIRAEDETRLLALMTEALARRSGLAASFWEGVIRARGDVWLDARQALDLGLADGILAGPSGVWRLPEGWPEPALGSSSGGSTGSQEPHLA